MPTRLASLLALLLFVFGHTAPAPAQVTIQGRVTDADTGDPLPQANLQVKGTYTGTITNADGHYALKIDSLPATVQIRYIGYEGVERRITKASDRRQDVQLAPSTVELNEVVVTGSENPGREIMRRVVEHKETWWDSLKTYEVNAYSRYTLSNDSGIVSIYETQTRAFWDWQKGMREVVRSRRQTDNLGVVDAALPAASAVLNLYQDNVEVAGARLMGVTHPDALDRYAFKLDTTRAFDGKRVYVIDVEPKSRLASAFVGEVSVLDSANAMIEARLEPARSLRLPRVVKRRSLSFEQQFSNFGGPFWLPVDFRAERTFELALSALVTLPRMHLNQVSRLTGYDLNVSLPDSLYDKDEDHVVEGPRVETIETEELRLDSLRRTGPYISLSDDERRAYAQSDSTQSLQEAFQPGGLLGSLLDLQASDNGLTIGSESDPSADSTRADSDSDTERSMSVEVSTPYPHVWYNRVEGLHVGGELSLGFGDVATVTGRGGHSFFLDSAARWSYGGTVATVLPSSVLGRFTASYRYGVDPRYTSEVRLFPPITQGVNTLWTLFGEPDYYDYLGNERLRVGVTGSVPATGGDARLQYRMERHFSLPDVSHYNALGRLTVFKRRTRQPPNPPVEEGHLRSVDLQIDWGDDAEIRGILPVNQVEVGVEHSASWLGSDYSFTRGRFSADARVETFFHRRVLPTTLDLRVVAGGALGTVPLQRFGVIEASPLPYTPFGALRTLDDRPYQGSEYAGLFWEHNFRTVPFEWLGLYGLVDRHIELLVHGGHARTWVDEEQTPQLRRRGISLRTSEGPHHEIGLSVNGLFRDLLRVDVSTRLDRQAVSLGVSLLRFF